MGIPYGDTRTGGKNGHGSGRPGSSGKLASLLGFALLVLPSLLLVSPRSPLYEARFARPPAPSVLVVEPDLRAKLATLAGGLRTEVALCLRGASDGDTAVAHSLYMPRPERSDPEHSVFDACPSGTLATWHNHPATSGSGPRAAARLCALSDTDLHTAIQLGYPFVVIGVDRRTWCWWSLDQIKRIATRPGPPVPGQGAWALGSVPDVRRAGR
ncbi:MAG: hypothetical protein ACE5HQ_10925 [Gemmatimonadota bacterium]